ncbi:MAG: ABC transporter ATP-binding protein [Nitriliruptoraceae bacterium]
MVSRAYQHDLNGSQLPPGSAQLTIEDVQLRFGGVQAIKDVSIEVLQGEVHAVIGPNGAGKTSLLNCISAVYRPQHGRILLHEQGVESVDLTTLRPAMVARRGVARSFQNIELFKQISVLDNLMLGRHVRMRHSVPLSAWFFGPARRQEIAHRELVEEVIDFLEIQAVRHAQVGALPYGVQKRVEVGRALCMQPTVLLLDEPMAGMNSEEKEDMARFILDVNDLAGVTVVLIEHDMEVVMDISDRVSVLDFGERITTGVPDQVQADQRVIEAYLGEEAST